MRPVPPPQHQMVVPFDVPLVVTASHRTRPSPHPPGRRRSSDVVRYVVRVNSAVIIQIEEGCRFGIPEGADFMAWWCLRCLVHTRTGSVAPSVVVAAPACGRQLVDVTTSQEGVWLQSSAHDEVWVTIERGQPTVTVGRRPRSCAHTRTRAVHPFGLPRPGPHQGYAFLFAPASATRSRQVEHGS